MAGDIDARFQLLDTSLGEIAQSNVGVRSPTGLSQIVEILVRAGRMAEGEAVLKRIEQLEAGCYTPEMLRLKGELSLLHGTPGAAETAKDHFQQALDEARRRGTLAWKLRAATSLARLLRKQGHSGDAIAVLHPVYNRFSEGFGTADLVAAKQLLDELGASDRD
jgi:predicted ATPase